MSKSKAMYKQIAEEILEQKTFDLSVDDKGCDTVWEMIAFSLMKNYSQKDQALNFQHVADSVKCLYQDAIDYLEDSASIIVYRSKLKGGDHTRNIQIITIESDYKESKNQEFVRIRDNVQKCVESNIKRIGKTDPGKLESFKLDTMKSLTA